jgi:hypothetical protein
VEGLKIQKKSHKWQSGKTAGNRIGKQVCKGMKQPCTAKATTYSLLLYQILMEKESMLISILHSRKETFEQKHVHDIILEYYKHFSDM